MSSSNQSAETTSKQAAATAEGNVERPDMLAVAGDKLSRLERAQVRAIRRSLEPGKVNGALRWCQRQIGTRWISAATYNLHHAHHLERVPVFKDDESFIVVCNHRSFFDLYVVTTELLKAGVKQRIVFPVRSEFFYDSALGFVVNGVMSFFAMYPPIFRQRRRAELSLVGLDELAWMLRRGGYFAGLHPEGQRNKSDDPYALLPARSGTGRLIYDAQVPVIPVFTNGLLPDDLPRQIRSNFDGTGQAVHTVFGAPLDLSEYYAQPRSHKVFKAIAERCKAVIEGLGQEEKQVRAEFDAGKLA